MNDSEQYKEHIEYTFAAFCKVVLRNASLSAYRDIARRQKREISLDYLMEGRYYNPSTTDKLFCEANKFDGIDCVRRENRNRK